MECLYRGQRVASHVRSSLMVKQAAAFVFRCYAEQRGPVQKHGCWFLDQRFPGMSFADQLRRVWITEARLCSLDEAGGAATAEHYRACGRDYLASQLALLPRARIVAFGSKAKAAMKRRGRSFIRQPSLPSQVVGGFVHVRGVPVHDRGDDQVPGHDALLLSVVRPVVNAAPGMSEYGSVVVAIRTPAARALSTWRNLSTTLRHRRLGFTEQAVAS